MPAVSIIVTIEDSSAQLDACLQGILDQTFTDYEAFFVSDGPCDELAAALARVASHDERFRNCVEGSNGTPTWQGALAQSSAPYLYLMDDATVLEPTALERLYGLADRLELDLAICNGTLVGEGSTASTAQGERTLRGDLLPLHEAFSADEVPSQLFEAVPLRSWDRLYERTLLTAAAAGDVASCPACDQALAASALTRAQRMDYLDDVLVSHTAFSRASVDDAILQLKRIKDQLVEAGLFDRFERDYLNFAARVLLDGTNAANATEQGAWQERLAGACEELGISAKNRKYFYQGSLYDQLKERRTWSAPSVSVLMPSLNVAPYIRECIESVLNQTLKTIEVLCIDAGSTDGTLEILREYERNDSRVRIIESDKRSYGYQMNLGLAAAQGEFIGIVETDDYADPEMFEALYRQAKRFDAQVVKGNYYDYRTKPVTKNVFHTSYYRLPYGCLLSQDERSEVLRRIPCIWSGIYQTKMLRDNAVGFLETPGASYQDTSFVLKVWSVVERAVLDERAFLHYRNDNEASSVRQKDKVYYVNGEFQSAYEYCVERHGSKSGYTKSLRCRQAVAYLWNFNRIADEFKRDYVERMREEFSVAQDKGELDRKYFWQKEWDAVNQIIKDPAAFLAAQAQDEAGVEQADEMALTLVVNACGSKRCLDYCLASIAYQDLSDTEVLFVDDQRSSTVSASLRAHVEQHEETRLVQGEGMTVAGLMAQAVAEARGTWILFADGSSAFEIDALEGLRNRLAANSADVVLLKYDLYDIQEERLIARGQGADLGRRRSLKVLNAQTDARSILQVASPHVANKAFRRSFVEREGLEMLDFACNYDIAFCELGLLLASEVAIDTGVPIDVLTGRETARDSALRRHPRHAVESWLTLFEKASARELLTPYQKTLLNAAASQLASDMDTLSDNYGARAALCRAIGGEGSRSSGIVGQSASFYTSERVFDHLRGAVQAIAFARDYAGLSAFFGKEYAGVEPVRPGVRAAASAIATVRNALFDLPEGDADQLSDALCDNEELMDRTAEVLGEADADAAFLSWCLPPNEQQLLEQLVGVGARYRKALSEGCTRDERLQSQLDDTKLQLQNTKRELAAMKKSLAAQKRNAEEDIQRAEEAVKASRSYRLGNALGAPLRAMRSVRDNIAGK